MDQAMRKFNTEGPVVAADHYCIPPLERVNLAEVLGLVRDKRYFALHAPRQTGKTSTLLVLRDLLNSGIEGDFRCVYVNIEAGQAAREDVERAMRIILGELASRAYSLGDEFLYAAWPDILATFGDGAFGEALTRWCEADPRPLVLLVDEIDTLIGDTLISVLRQLRARHDRRPRSFPQSVVLCGGARRARLPHPFALGERGDYRRQRIQHQGRIAPTRRLHASRGARAARPAHRGDPSNPESTVDKFVIECKVLHKSLERTVGEGSGANGRLHGPLRERRGPPRHLRPKRRKAMGRQDLPPRGTYRRPHHHRVGGCDRRVPAIRASPFDGRHAYSMKASAEIPNRFDNADT